MDASLLFDDRGIDRRGLPVPPWLAAIAVAVTALAPIAAAAVAPSPPMLFAFAIRRRRLTFGGERMELRSFA